ncbi:MAG: LysR family transcriptional regulator, partial [Synergistaceae bacterium]|nr:LysR family transcriptional regulator [Synergistaceae bacterium]
MSHIRYFVEVAHTKSMTAAAKNLHISQPSLSYAVKAIEDEIGIPL